VQLHRLVLLPLLCSGLAPAQKLALDDGSSRVLQLVDVEDLLVGGDPAATESPLQRLATFLREQIDPPLGPNHDIRPLGRHALALLLQEAQATWVERRLADARAAKGTVILVETHICEVTHEAYTMLVQRFLGANVATQKVQTAVVTATDAERLRQGLVEIDGCNLLTAPRVAVRPLMVASMQVGEDVSYVKDFTVTLVDGKWVAEPVLHKVFDGTRIEVIATPLGTGQIGLSYDMLTQTLARPILEFKTKLGTTEDLTVQLPNTQGQRICQSVALREDAAALMATQAASGRHVLAFVSARAVKENADDKARVVR
jgi:hypothetical protein